MSLVKYIYKYEIYVWKSYSTKEKVTYKQGACSRRKEGFTFPREMEPTYLVGLMGAGRRNVVENGDHA
jgi:hypothetical protein